LTINQTILDPDVSAPFTTLINGEDLVSGMAKGTSTPSTHKERARKRRKPYLEPGRASVIKIVER
jgi:hypothetical protein